MFVEQTLASPGSAKHSALHWPSPNCRKLGTSDIRSGGFISSPLLGDILLLKIFCRHGQSQGLLYKHLRHQLIHEVTHSSFVKISLRRCHIKMVQGGAFSHKIDDLREFGRFKISNGIKIPSLVQELRRFCWMAGFCLLVELHREGSVPAAYALQNIFSCKISARSGDEIEYATGWFSQPKQWSYYL